MDPRQGQFPVWLLLPPNVMRKPKLKALSGRHGTRALHGGHHSFLGKVSIANSKKKQRYVHFSDYVSVKQTNKQTMDITSCFLMTLRFF